MHYLTNITKLTISHLFLFLKASRNSVVSCSVGAISSLALCYAMMPQPPSNPQAFTNVNLGHVRSRLAFAIFARNNYHFDS